MIVTDIYAAREKDTGIVSSKDIVDRMADYDVDVHYIKEFDDIEKFILKKLQKKMSVDKLWGPETSILSEIRS